MPAAGLSMMAALPLTLQQLFFWTGLLFWAFAAAVLALVIAEMLAPQRPRKPGAWRAERRPFYRPAAGAMWYRSEDGWRVEAGTDAEIVEHFLEVSVGSR